MAGIKGVSAVSDNRFSDKDKKLLKTMKFPKWASNVQQEYQLKVNLKKINWEVMKPWIAKRVTDLLGMEDEVLIAYIYEQLEDKNEVDPRQLQINLTGFLEKNTSLFVKVLDSDMDFTQRELWTYLASATANDSGIPQQILDEKAEELRKKKEIQDQINEKLAKEREKRNEEAREAAKAAAEAREAAQKARHAERLAGDGHGSKPREEGRRDVRREGNSRWDHEDKDRRREGASRLDDRERGPRDREADRRGHGRDRSPDRRRERHRDEFSPQGRREHDRSPVHKRGRHERSPDGRDRRSPERPRDARDRSPRRNAGLNGERLPGPPAEGLPPPGKDAGADGETAATDRDEAMGDGAAADKKQKKDRKHKKHKKAKKEKKRKQEEQGDNGDSSGSEPADREAQKRLEEELREQALQRLQQTA